MTFSPLDLAFIALIVIVIVKVTLTGFVTEFFSKAAAVIGATGAVLFYRKLVPFIVKYLGVNVFPEAISFLAIFLVLYLAVKAIQQLVGNAFESESMDNLDRALGFFLGFAEGILLVAIILLAMQAQPWINLANLTENSIFARLLGPVIAGGTGFIPDFAHGQ